MSRHLPPAHPELAFYRYWEAKALFNQASGMSGAGSKTERTALLKRSKAAATTAADALALAYGKDHPTVDKWRSGNDAWAVGGRV